MSIYNSKIRTIPSDLFGHCIFKFAVEDNPQTPSETVQSICLVCKEWTDLTYKNLLPLYWKGVKSLINTLAPNQNSIRIATKLNDNDVGLIPFKRLSKMFGSPSLMILPCQYHKRLIDASLEKMWGRICQQIDFGQDNPPRSASEIRAWLKDPNNIPLIQNVRTLDLSRLELTYLPCEIADLTNLLQLQLNNNQLKELPSEIGNLINLQGLNLDCNQLTGLPSEIGNLANLGILYLDYNQLIELPSEIGNLGNLHQLSLIKNQLRELPSEIGDLTNLKLLFVDCNQLRKLPSEIGKLTNLQHLNLEHNQLTGLPSEIGKLANLQHLNLNNNLYLFMLDKELSKFLNISTINLKYKLLKKYNECKQYNTKTPFAKLCQHIHNQADTDLLKAMFGHLPSPMQNKIRSKIEDIFVGLPENQNIENKELLKSQALLTIFDARRDILTRAILDILKETFSSFTPEQKSLAYHHVWNLAEKPQGDNNWGENHAEDNVIRFIDAIVLASNAAE